MGAKKGGGTQGYRYYMSLLSGLCRGPIDEVVAIRVGDEEAWNGHACSDVPDYIDAPNLFGGDDKEGGIQGPFAVFMGGRDQVLPSAQTVDPGLSDNGFAGIIADIFLHRVRSLPSVKDSIGGRVSDMRGVATLWFDGMVAAMNPYLKEWKFRVRRTTKGWLGGHPWYSAKATIFLGGDSLSVATNRVTDFAVAQLDNGDFTITVNRNFFTNDTVTINGQVITYVDDNPGQYELKAESNTAKSIRSLVNFINGASTAFKATATSAGTVITIKANVAASQIYAANASHMVYECYTNSEWGRGLLPSDLDEGTFIAAADTLCAERFGLCLAWYRKEDIDVFIQKVCDLVGATTYTDRETGLMVFRLIRADYNVDDLPLFTPTTGLMSIDQDDSGSSDDTYNEIIGTSRDPISNLDFQVRAQNPGAYQAQGAPSSMDQDYKGIPTKSLLSRVVLRDLRAMGSGLKKYSITLDRRGWRVAPGSVIRISHPGRGIANLVLRVGEIDDGNMINGQIKIKAAIDVYGLPASSYTGEADNGWIAPSKVAVPAVEELLEEASYRDVYRNLGATQANLQEPTSAFIGQLAKAPNSTSLQYELASKAEGDADYTLRTLGNFSGNAYLTDDVAPLDTAWQLKDLSYLTQANVGQALLCGAEIVKLVALDDDTKIATVARGCGDTIPAAHAAGDILWTVDDDLTTDGQTWIVGETVDTKVLTKTSTQMLDPTLADVLEITLAGRHAMPYVPGDMKVGGISIYSPLGEQPEPVFTWAERNRLTEADDLVAHTDGTMTPEVGQTYNIRIIDSTDGTTVIRETTGITGTTWTYDSTMITADSPTSVVIVEIEAERDGIVSWQKYRFAVALHAGWGYGWGYNWGGN